MLIKPHKLAIGLTAGYSFVVSVYLLTLIRPSYAFDLIGIVVLTLPWSMFAVYILDTIDPTLLDNPNVGIIGLLIGAVINASAIYFGTCWSINRSTTKP